jgi:hypothetical protein
MVKASAPRRLTQVKRATLAVGCGKAQPTPNAKQKIIKNQILIKIPCCTPRVLPAALRTLPQARGRIDMGHAGCGKQAYS